MTGRIPDETIQAIRDRISLVEVVSGYVSLKRSGRNYVGLCPFHGEKTPSFTVNEERGLFHCFGCGAGGTVFTFFMRVERLEFPEAVEQLAKRAGVTLPARGQGGAGSALRERLAGLNAEAARFFRQALDGAAGAEARRYLASRGLKPETIERYGLGVAPASGSALASWLAQRAAPRDLAVQVGLLGRRDDGSLYDRFRGRVMFPIRDRRDQVIGFGGRALGADPPKYLNSPESALFRKGEVLYGLAEARDAIRASDRVVLVEGYLDALLLVQEGVPYAVATLGTALTVSHLSVLRRFTENVIAFFDGDEAGRAAAVRAFGVCAEAGVWARAAFLPEGVDPDRHIRQHGCAATLALLDAATPLADFYFDRLAPPGASLPQRAQAAAEVSRTLARVRDDLQFELVVHQAAARLGLSEDLFRAARARSAAGPPPVPVAAGAAPKWPAAELLLVETIAADREVANWVADRGTVRLFADTGLARAAQQLIEAWEQDGQVGPVVEALPEALASRLTAALLGSGGTEEADPMKVAADCVTRIERRAQRDRRRALAAELRHAEGRGDDARSQAQLERLNQLLRREGGSW